MTTRARCLMCVCAAIAALALALASDETVAAQGNGDARAARGQGTQAAKTIPRTPWGTPDLQGIWNTNTLVPLERNRQYGTRALMTEEEHAKALAELQQRNQRPGRDSREVAGKSGLGTEKDVARAYNEFWFGDKPTKLSYRTSMIVDPPDGRIPPLTAEAAKRVEDKREFLAALLQGTSGGRPGPISPRRAEPSPDYNLDRINRADGPEDRGGPERCFGDTPPVTMGTGTFGGVMQLVQAPDSVSIYYDIGQGQGFSWVIPITNRPHLPKSVRLYRGDAVGHWQGDLHGRRARSLGGGHPGCRRDQLQRRDELPRLARKPAPDSTLPPPRREHAASGVHRRGSDDVDAAMDRGPGTRSG